MEYRLPRADGNVHSKGRLENLFFGQTEVGLSRKALVGASQGFKQKGRSTPYGLTSDMLLTLESLFGLISTICYEYRFPPSIPSILNVSPGILFPSSVRVQSRRSHSHTME